MSWPAAVCRVCMTQGKHLIPFARFDADRKAYRLAEAISAVGAIQVENGDGLPQYCCVRCVRGIESAFKMQRVCQETDWRLRELYQLQQERLTEAEELVFKEECEESRLQETVAGVVAIKQEVEEPLDGAGSEVAIKKEIDGAMEVAENGEAHREAVEEQCQSDDDDSKKAKICCGCSQYCNSQEELIAHSVEVHYPLRLGSDSLRPFFCDICYQNLPNKNDLDEHKKHFRDERKKFLCGKCGKGFYTNKSLNWHRRSHGPKLGKCYMCPFVSTTAAQLRDHVDKHSLSNGTYKCFVCGACLSTPAKLNKHSEEHPRKIPYKCPYCPRVFNLKKWLTNHIKKHGEHEITGE